MGRIASQITCLTIAYSSVYSGAGQRKHQSSVSLAFAGTSPVTGELPAQKDSNAENVSIWWRHHDIYIFEQPYPRHFMAWNLLTARIIIMGSRNGRFADNEENMEWM